MTREELVETVAKATIAPIFDYAAYCGQISRVICAIEAAGMAIVERNTRARVTRVTPDRRREIAIHAAAARHASLTPEQRSAIARNAANKRWKAGKS